MDMQMRDIEYFSVVAERGNVGRAAEALGLSQPALSKSLRRLEKSVGAKLVKRTPKGVDLTAVGAALYSQSRRLRLSLDDVMHEIEDLSQARTGHVRIGTVAGIAEDVVSAASVALLKQAPNATLAVTVSSADALLLSLRDGQLDLTVASTSPAPSEGLARERLFDDEFVVYASAGHRLARQKRVALSDLTQELWASGSHAAVSWQELCRAFEGRGFSSPRVALECSSTSVRLHAIASSNLLGFSSRRFVKRAARRYRLAELPTAGISVNRRIEVLHRKDGYLSPMARRLMDILKSLHAG
jgi:DNA-binding transcriptional LysR family regulator